jgi:hypothetical protein
MKTNGMQSLYCILAASVFFLFTSVISPCSAQTLDPQAWPNLKGYWTFQDTTQLEKATVGNDLVLVGTHEWVEGPNYGDYASRIAIGSYYKSYHNIPPNGGGDSVNRYTLMFDFRVLNFERWHTFHQTDSTNMNDGECFIKPQSAGIDKSVFGTATTGYTLDSLEANTWYRMVISVCLDSFYRYYINGNLWLDTNNQVVDGRFALTPLLLLFADNNQEDDTIDVSSVAIFDTCLTHAQIAQLGGLDPCIHNPPVVNIGNDTTLFYCETANLMLDAGSGFKNYLWSTGDTTQSILIDSNSFATTNILNLWVKVTDMNDCQATDSITVDCILWTGVPEPTVSYTIKIGPNPADDFIYFSLPEGDSQISIFNVTGQRVLETKTSGSETETIDIKTLAAGVYIIRVEGEHFVYSQKLIRK